MWATYLLCHTCAQQQIFTIIYHIYQQQHLNSASKNVIYTRARAWIANQQILKCKNENKSVKNVSVYQPVCPSSACLLQCLRQYLSAILIYLDYLLLYKYICIYEYVCSDELGWKHMANWLLYGSFCSLLVNKFISLHLFSIKINMWAQSKVWKGGGYSIYKT